MVFPVCDEHPLGVAASATVFYTFILCTGFLNVLGLITAASTGAGETRGEGVWPCPYA